LYPAQIADVRSRLIQTLPVDPDRISALSDRIQKSAKYSPTLTSGCEFSQAQVMRRLLILPVKGWTDGDARRAENAIAAITALKAQEGPLAALQLACYGIERGDLEAAIATLEAAKAAAEQATPQDEAGPQAAPDGVEVELNVLFPPVATQKVTVKVEKPAKPPKAAKPAAPLSSLEDLDEGELDPDTQAQLEALKRDVQGLKK
jgi:hypothetical protein